MKIRNWSSAFVLLALAACNAKGPCESHYDTPAEQQACIVGAEVEGYQVNRSRGGSMASAEIGRVCSDRCGTRYNDSRIQPSSDASYFEAVAEMTRMLAACRDACRVAVQYEIDLVNSPAADPGCLEYRGPGGSGGCR